MIFIGLTDIAGAIFQKNVLPGYKVFRSGVDYKILFTAMKGLYTILLLIFSNIFMTFAWYGHLKFQHLSFFQKTGLFGVIMASWLIAFMEYCLMVPANRMGYAENGGAFTLVQLKVLQEVITLLVFTVFTLVFFKSEALKWNHFVGFAFLVLAVYFIRK